MLTWSHSSVHAHPVALTRSRHADETRSRSRHAHSVTPRSAGRILSAARHAVPTRSPRGRHVVATPSPRGRHAIQQSPPDRHAVVVAWSRGRHPGVTDATRAVATRSPRTERRWMSCHTREGSACAGSMRWITQGGRGSRSHPQRAPARVRARRHASPRTGMTPHAMPMSPRPHLHSAATTPPQRCRHAAASLCRRGRISTHHHHATDTDTDTDTSPSA